MSKFDHYFLMEPADVIDYMKEKVDFFESGCDLECREIGDGNLNYVFKVWDNKTSKSVIIKQAGVTARISDEFKLSTNRIRIESEVLQLQGKLAPGLVPIVYKFDQVMSCCVMEDLSDHTIMREALLNHQVFPMFANDITTFMVNTLFNTTDLVLDHKSKKEYVGNFINSELCEITEDLVYTEPFNDYNNRNELFPANKEWITKEIYHDDALRLEVAKLKFDFMSNAQALIHGDLHTGSIFIKDNSTKVIDPEFAFYGPIGYDLGNVIANLIFAWANGQATISDQAKKNRFIDWIEETIVEVIDQFKEKFLEVMNQNTQEILAKENGFDSWYVDEIIKDAAGVTGLELSRRIIGLAKVKDITTIEQVEQRVQAERTCLIAAKQFIKERETFKNGKDFLKVLMHSKASAQS